MAIMKLYGETVIVPRADYEKDPSILAQVREDMQNKLEASARRDDQDLPGEFLFRVEYIIEDPNAAQGVDPYVEVPFDEAWEFIIAKGRLSAGG